MSNKNLCIDLKSAKDRDGAIYYIAKLRAPILIDAKDGIVFLVFVSDEGNEEMQIANFIPREGKDQYEPNE